MKKNVMLGIILLLLSLNLSGCGEDELYSQDNPVTITVWHYYTGGLQQEFEEKVADFNIKEGKDNGITLQVKKVADIDELTSKIVSASNKELGTDGLPDLIFAYSSTVLDLDNKGLIKGLDSYFSETELEQYLSAYIEEGRIGKENQLKLFPVAKSSEVVYVENVAYSKFKKEANASGKYGKVEDSMLTSFEGIRKIADVYYQWTDDQTPETAYDGKAFFGIDAVPNYISVGTRQLSGKPPISVNSDLKPSFSMSEETGKKLFEYYYGAMIEGRFTDIGSYRADDMKTGDVIAYLGSTGGATYFPTVVENETANYETELLISPYPVFEGGRKVSIQQGAGMAVIKTEERREAAAVQFLKWFTKPEQNVSYSMSSGYSPVMKEEQVGKLLTTKIEELQKSDEVLENNISKVLLLASDQMNQYELTVDKEFEGSYNIRNSLGETLSEQAKADRERFLKELAAGVTYEELVKRFVSEDAFKTWFDTIRSSVK